MQFSSFGYITGGRYCMNAFLMVISSFYTILVYVYMKACSYFLYIIGRPFAYTCKKIYADM